MKKHLTRFTLMMLGWIFVLLGFVGAFLPILPTTPFLILALALFSKSSPRFHEMLLNNPWFGATLRQWEREKTLARRVKYKASLLIACCFALSISLLAGREQLQLMLIVFAVILLVFIWRIREPAESGCS